MYQFELTLTVTDLSLVSPFLKELAEEGYISELSEGNHSSVWVPDVQEAHIKWKGIWEDHDPYTFDEDIIERDMHSGATRRMDEAEQQSLRDRDRDVTGYYQNPGSEGQGIIEEMNAHLEEK